MMQEAHHTVKALTSSQQIWLSDIMRKLIKLTHMQAYFYPCSP